MTARVLWLLLAFVLAVGVPFFAVGTQTGTCSNGNATGEMVCTYEPTIGWPAVVFACLAAWLAAAWAVRKSTGRR